MATKAKALAAGLGDAAEKARAKAAERLRQALDTPAVEAAQDAAHAMSKARTKVRDTWLRAARGYDDFDIWEAGDRIAEHVADVTEAFADACEGSGADAGWRGEAKVRCETIRLYANYDPVGLGPIPVPGDGDRERLDARLAELADRRFREAWEWVGGNAMTLPAGDPLGHGGAKGAMHGVADRLATAAAHAAGRVAASDLSGFPVSELRRTASILDAYAERSSGCPVCYADMGPRLCDDWDPADHLDETLPLEVRWAANRDVLREAAREHGKPHTELTVGEVGGDYVAFVMDVATASEAIRAWADWLAATRLPELAGAQPTERLLAHLGDIDTEGKGLSDFYEGHAQEEFLKAWRWLGEAIPAIWV